MALNSSSSKFERVFNYSLVGVLVFLGLLIISGVFRSMPSDFRNIFGGIILVYGLVRFLLLSNRYRKEKKTDEKKE